MQTCRLVVFGGRGADKKRLNDVHFLDVTTWAWHRPTTDGVPPSVRLGAAAVFMGGQMIIFGGYGAGARLNDLHTLDLTSWQWQQPAFTGTAPSPRQSAGIALHGEAHAIHKLWTWLVLMVKHISRTGIGKLVKVYR